MRVFVCETVTGGGLAGKALPASLAAEGALMRDALIGDLEDLPGVRVVTTHDARLPPPPRGASAALGPRDNVRAAWTRLATCADIAWPIAPETGGELAALATLMAAAGCRTIGPNLATLEVCISKLATAAALRAAGIATVPTYRPDEVPAELAGPFVLKPDDGAGCLDTVVVESLPDAPAGVVQPFIAGEPASLVLLCRADAPPLVLSANRQLVERRDGRFAFRGVVVGALPVTDELRALAARVQTALPGLSGWVGLDYIATQQGPIVLEVNPRLTTSYAGLRRALGINPLGLMTDFCKASPPLPVTQPVELRL
ncbi:MAG TPA: ATP-grasp domain-containing protein [Xanthobacteraceae bacterium]|nr:ATP-grasp domain-containing protein [Xanthobacteraceae bacterium]